LTLKPITTGLSTNLVVTDLFRGWISRKHLF